MEMKNNDTGRLENKSYLRHIKRHVQAPSHRFAAIAPPEIISLCERELMDLEIETTETNEAGEKIGIR